MKTKSQLREELADAAITWAEQDAIVRAETKSYRALAALHGRAEPEAGLGEAVPICITAWAEAGESGCVEAMEWCDHCKAHGDRRPIRHGAMLKREGAKRRLRSLAAKIEAAI